MSEFKHDGKATWVGMTMIGAAVSVWAWSALQILGGINNGLAGLFGAWH